jgi:uncharacterized membrane protein YgcG
VTVNLALVFLLAAPQGGSSFIADEGGVLHPGQEETALHMIRKIEASHSVEVGLVTVLSTEGKGIDAYAAEAARAHGFDRKRNGLLMVVAVRDRRARIVVGDDLRRRLPEDLCDRIIRDEMVPHFIHGRIGDGTFAGLAAAVTSVRGDYQPRPPYVRYRRRFQLIPWWGYLLAVGIYVFVIHRKLGEFGGGFVVGRWARKTGRSPDFQGSGASGRWC